MRRKVRIEHGRRLAITRQRLSGPRPKPVTTDDIQTLVRAIGCLQLDPTAIIARNHLLVLFSRLGAFDPKLVDTLLWDQRRLYEYWAHQASIVPAGRLGSGRRWALADTWFRTPIGPIPEHTVALRQAAVRSLRALGVATQKQVKIHFVRHRYQGLASVWKDLEAAERIVPVELGLKGDWYVHADDLELLDQIESGGFVPRTTLLSPFDNLICDRDRTLALWGFDFKLEIYVPKSKRWGYFVMPLLHGDRVIARFDLAVDRKDGVLNVIGERWEPGWDGRRRPVRSRNRALAELAGFLGVGVRR